MVDIVALCNAGSEYKEVAERFGVGLTTIGEIMRGAAWSRVTGIKNARQRRMSDEDVIKCVAMAKDGVPVTTIAASVGMSRACIQKILAGKSRSDVSGIISRKCDPKHKALR